MELIILALSVLFFGVLILGLWNRSKDSFFIKIYGLDNHKNKYFIQNMVNYLLCATILIITYFLYFYHINKIIIVLIPIIIKLTIVLLKRIIE